MKPIQRFLSIRTEIHILVASVFATAAIHLALVPEHLREAPLLGVLFLLAGIAGLAVVPAIYLNTGPWRIATALLLVSMIIGYGITRVSGYEEWDVLGLVTKMIESVGLVAIWHTTPTTRTSARRRHWATVGLGAGS